MVKCRVQFVSLVTAIILVHLRTLSLPLYSNILQAYLYSHDVNPPTFSISKVSSKVSYFPGISKDQIKSFILIFFYIGKSANFFSILHFKMKGVIIFAL